MDFSVIKESGLTQNEFANLAGVTRATINKYVAGKVDVASRVENSVKRALAVVTFAVRTQKLPGGLPGPSRWTAHRRKELIADVFAASEAELKKLRARRQQRDG